MMLMMMRRRRMTIIMTIMMMMVVMMMMTMRRMALTRPRDLRAVRLPSRCTARLPPNARTRPAEAPARPRPWSEVPLESLFLWTWAYLN